VITCHIPKNTLEGLHPKWFNVTIGDFKEYVVTNEKMITIISVE
jgi:hypothetical protein